WSAPEVEASPAVKFLAPSQRAELSPADAERLGIADGDSVAVVHDGARLGAEAAVRSRVPPGAVFLAEAVEGAGANLLTDGQPLADIIKLLTKEQSRPYTAAGFLYAVAPVISIVTAVASFAIIPFGDVHSIFGTRTGLYGVDVSIGPLYLFAFGAIAFYGLMLGGWSSGSKYSFLGAMRGAAQLISYEVSQGLALVGVIITAQTLSLTGIVHAQGGMWYIVPQFFGFLVFLVAGFAETNRAPFDLTEADAELVGGYNTEYGGGRFASSHLAGYLDLVIAPG